MYTSQSFSSSAEKVPYRKDLEEFPFINHRSEILPLSTLIEICTCTWEPNQPGTWGWGWPCSWPWRTWPGRTGWAAGRPSPWAACRARPAAPPSASPPAATTATRSTRGGRRRGPRSAAWTPRRSSSWSSSRPSASSWRFDSGTLALFWLYFVRLREGRCKDKVAIIANYLC